MVGPPFAEAQMVDVHTTTRPLPQSTVQLVGQATSDVVGGISRGSIGLAVVALNVIGIAAAVYFLNLLISGQQQHLKSLLEVQTSNMKQILDVHQKEFDALLDLASREALASRTAGAAPTSSVPVLPPTTTTTPPRR